MPAGSRGDGDGDPGAAQPGRLSTDRTTIDGIRVVTLHGEVDDTVEDILTQALLPPADAPPPRTVADLSGVTFMDSSGINVFVFAHQAVSSAQGWLRLADAREAVLRVLQIVGLDEIIPCHPTVG
ncbi:STAS domain-containing protein [Streptomyces sp. NPDC001815]|uniref:STAS domain-containing protein n=1 Tax=Streptomyces sp. NPDC001815 TaxID=3154526 RepID=UPI00331DB8D8